MVRKIQDIETITCQTEVEALILETNLIKHLSPKYNILMKDDKNHAYIKITNSPVPEVIKTRQRFDDGGEYFGPYVTSVEQSLRTLKRIFRIRNCRVKFEQKKWISSKENPEIIITDKAGKTIPCMDYYIGICPAPCLLKKENREIHSESISLLRDFLDGKSQWIFQKLQWEMNAYAKDLNFEKAQEVKVSLESLKSLYEKQIVRDNVHGNIDILVKYEKYEKVYIWFSQIREGKIVAVNRYEMSLGADDLIEWIASFLMTKYVDGEIPEILLLDEKIEDSAFVDFLKHKSIVLEIPKIWPKKDIIQFTLNQTREFAYKKELTNLGNKTLLREHMVHILDSLGYAIPSHKILTFECYDISHTDWHFTYASRVVMENGKMVPKKYKKYKIKSLQDGMIDDFASHREVMKRRTLEWIEQNNFPHLIIIDGWKWQLSSAILGVEDALKISETQLDAPISVCSLAKREEEIFLPHTSSPILFEKGTPELMILQKLRDESHRFSINANKSARMKSMKKNILEEIPWIWPKTRKALLKIAGSIDWIKDLSPEQIEKIANSKQREILRDHGVISLD